MKVDKQRFVTGYHEADKFKDNWQQGVKLLPFSSNASTSGFDKLCSLQNTVGEFARLANDDGTQPIKEFESSVIEPIRKYLARKRMSESQIEDFVKVVRDVFFINGNLNIADPSFFKFIPLVPEAGITDAEKKKYADGQRKMADYIFSMYKGAPIQFNKVDSDNLFLRIVSDALAESVFAQPKGDNSQGNYLIPPYISKAFTSDLTWMLQQTEQVQVRYLHLLLHFYACYCITQSLFLMSSKKLRAKDMESPTALYFILASEKVSMNHDAVLRGWTYKVQKCKTLERLYGKMQAIDIANSILGEKVGYYPQILSALEETPFEDNKQALTEVLETYVREKTAYIHARKTEKHQTIKDSIDFSKYEDFLHKLEHCCVELQSVSYVGRFKKKVLDILGIRFLQLRRGNYVLVLDNEMLTFLIALMTKGKKTKLEQLYKCFNNYGMYFNRETRSAIEEYLLKMNLLDRKSDSGEVQYVRPVL